MISMMSTERSGVVESWVPNPKPRPGQRRSSLPKKQPKECPRFSCFYKFGVIFLCYYMGAYTS